MPEPNPEPKIVTVIPATPEDGVKELITGPNKRLLADGLPLLSVEFDALFDKGNSFSS